MGNDLILNILLKANSSGASGVIKSFASDLTSLGGAGGAAGIAAGAVVAIGAAVLGVGVVSTKMAGDFQQAMLSNVAHAGLAKSQMDAVTQSVLNMSSQVGRSPTELAEALYPILSAFSGISNQSAKSALALSTLKLSFEAVAGTTVNGTDVANAAVGTFNALGLATNNAGLNAKRMSSLFDIMDLTVQEGNMQWGAYKNVISKLAVSIQGTSVTFTEASSALATLTNEGFSAQKAQTYLSNMFTTMAIKTDALAKHAKALKISFDEQKYSSMSLADKISYLNEVTGGNKQKILALLGGNATALKAFNALSTGIVAYKENLEHLNHAHGALAASFATAASGFNFSMSRIKAAVDALLVGLGMHLLPILTQITNGIGPIIANFASWVGSSQGLGSALDGVGASLGGVVNWLKSFDVTAVTYQFKALGSTVQSSVGSAFSGLSGVIRSFLGDGSGIKNFFSQLAVGGLSMAADALHALRDDVQLVSNAFQQHILPAIRQALPGFKALASAIGDNLIPVFKSIFEARLQVGQAVFRIVTVFEENLLPILIKVAGWLSGGLAQAIRFLSPYFQQAMKAVGQFAGEVATRLIPIIRNLAGFISRGLDTVMRVWNTVWPYLAPVLKGVWDEIQGVIKIAWSLVSGIIKIGLDILGGNWSQAWSDFKDMLSGVWDGIKSILKGGWEIITGWARAAWAGIVHVVQAPLIGLRDWLVGLWTTISSAAQTGWGRLTGAIQGAVSAVVGWLGATWQRAVNTVVGWFSWLYNHNYYFQHLVDFIVSTFTRAKAWLTNVWETITGWISAKWQWLKDEATVYFTAVYVEIQTRVEQAETFLHTIWTNVTGWLSGVWNTIVSDVQSGWQKIAAIFSGAWNTYIAGPLASTKNQFTSFFGGLATLAVQWGQNLISGFLSGIKNAAGGIGNFVNTNVIGPIKSFMGFHSPAEQGDGRDIVTWGANAVLAFTQGMQQRASAVADTADALTRTLHRHLGRQHKTHQKRAGLGPLSGGASNTTVGSIGSASFSGSGATYIFNTTIHPTIVVPQGTPKQQAELIFKELDKLLARKLRLSGIDTNQATGGAA